VPTASRTAALWTIGQPERVTAKSLRAAYRDRVHLTRGRVIAAAMALIESEGAHAVSMPRLATELGCGLVALYSHVDSTQALLDGVAADVVSGIEVTESPDACWLARLRAQALAMRRAAAAHPRCTIAVAGRPPATAAVSRPAEQALGTLRAAGFGGPDAIRILRALAAYQVGCLVLEVGVAPSLRAGGDADGAGSARPALRRAAFPHLTAVSAELAGASRDANPGADFEFGLDLLLRGMAGLPGAQPTGS
jgi:AcrR family transcriptional regulator